MPPSGDPLSRPELALSDLVWSVLLGVFSKHADKVEGGDARDAEACAARFSQVRSLLQDRSIRYHLARVQAQAERIALDPLGDHCPPIVRRTTYLKETTEAGIAFDRIVGGLPDGSAGSGCAKEAWRGARIGGCTAGPPRRRIHLPQVRVSGDDPSAWRRLAVGSVMHLEAAPVTLAQIGADVILEAPDNATRAGSWEHAVDSAGDAIPAVPAGLAADANSAETNISLAAGGGHAPDSSDR